MSVTTRRQRGSAAAAGAARGAATADEPPHTAQPTRWDYARFAALQHSGLALCVLGLALMACGYGRQWVHDTHLSLVSLALCLLGLFMHETRPYKRDDEFKQQMAGNAGGKDE